MNEYRKGHHGLAVIAVLALAALLGACGTDSPTGSTTQTQAGLVTESAGTVGLKTCTSCHTAATADWMLTKHANVEPTGNLYSTGNPTLGQLATCLKNCHDANGDGANTAPFQFVSSYTGTQRPVVSCESCHGGGEFHVAAGGAGPINRYAAKSGSTVTGPSGTVVQSGQFNTCTYCHELLLATDPASTTTPATAEHVATVPTGSTYIITDTHFATPGDWTGSGGASIKNITGYAMNYSSATVCSDCHNPHKSADINRAWAQSAHADTNALVTAYWSGAWAHYDWSSRGSCQRCHTTTGFAAYADALRSGDLTRAWSINAGTTKVLATATTPSWKPEMLQCRGCHLDNKGTLRNPGPVTTDYSYSTTTNNVTYKVSEASFAFPDAGASNVCLACHTGRENGETLKNLVLNTAPSITSYANLSFINSHYLTGGGTVYRATGFEFVGRSYEDPATYRHVQIGSSAAPQTGTNGPCVGCHMSRPAGNGNHLFMPVTRNTTSIGHIDSIASEVCIYCHTVSGAGGLEDLINERKEEYIEAIEATIYVLDKRGFYFRGANPYFFQKRTNAGSVASIAGTTVNNGGSVDWVAAGVSASASAPDYFKMDNDGTYYRITAVAIGSVTITPAYSGTITSGNYTIIKSGTAGSTKNWLTQVSSGIVPASVTDTDTLGYTTGRYNLGAAFNLNLLEHEPGAYVHNRIYAKRLLYDAIDWADDNLMNYSVGNTLNTIAINGADPFWKIGAMKYLLPYGVLGIAAERP